MDAEVRRFPTRRAGEKSSASLIVRDLSSAGGIDTGESGGVYVYR